MKLVIKTIHKLKISLLVLFHIDPIIINQVSSLPKIWLGRQDDPMK